MSSKKESSDKPETDAERASKEDKESSGAVVASKADAERASKKDKESSGIVVASKADAKRALKAYKDSLPHIRKKHRLNTARYLILGGGIGVFAFAAITVLCYVYTGSIEVLEYGKDITIAFFGIIGIALGFIAGSSVE